MYITVSLPKYAIRTLVLGLTAALGLSQVLDSCSVTRFVRGVRRVWRTGVHIQLPITLFRHLLVTWEHSHRTANLRGIPDSFLILVPVIFVYLSRSWNDIDKLLNNRIPYPAIRIRPAMSHLTRKPVARIPVNRLTSRLWIEGSWSNCGHVPGKVFLHSTLLPSVLHNQCAVSLCILSQVQ